MVEPVTASNEALSNQLQIKPFVLLHALDADVLVPCDTMFYGTCLSTQLENEKTNNKKAADKLIVQLFAVMKKA